MDDQTLIPFIRNAALTIEEWRKNKEIVVAQEKHDDIEVGHAAFYLNRTNISGIIKGGPIGGAAQSGRYKLDARFQKEGLISKIETIRKKREFIELVSLDVLDFIKTKLVSMDKDNTFVYFDPPYVEKGPQLYENSFTNDDHETLATQIRSLPMKWLVTYDDCELIRQLYKGEEIETLSIAYSAGRAKRGNELAVRSKWTSKHIGEHVG